MTEHDETRRIEPVEPTRVLGSEPTVAIEPTRTLDPGQAGAAVEPTRILDPGQSSTIDSAAQAPRRAVSPGHPAAVSPQAATPQPWYPPSGQPQQFGYPASYGYPQPGYSQQGYPPPGYAPPAYPQPGYPPPGYPQAGYTQAAQRQAGSATPGYPQPGYPQPAHGQPGYPQPGYPYQGFQTSGQFSPAPNPQSISAGPYARYANPSAPGSARQPYDPYATAYPPVQPWPGAAPTAPAAPKRHTGRTILVVALALVMALTGFAWALRPLLEQSARPVAPIAEPNQPGVDPGPGTGPITEPDPDPRPGSGGSAAESVGIVFVEGETSGGIGAGTGMVLTSDGKVLTNYHVVAGTQSLQVTVADSGESYVATVLGYDQSKDVALLQLQDASGLDTVTIDRDEVNVGDPVAALGNAGGNNELVRAPGEVVALDRNLTVNSDSPWGAQEDLEGVIETTAGAVPGHSGGPMFDDEGEVLGITTAGSTQAGRSYAVPIADALDVVSTIETGQDAGTVRVGPAGYMGIVIGEASRHGVIISEVVPDSPADRAGIEVGSTLVKVGDTRVSETTNLATVIRSLEPGDDVTVEWFTPSGRQRSASVTLEASPVN